MQTRNTVLILPSPLEIVLERTFDAPRDLVWKAYTEPERVAKWWGLRNSTMIVDTMDLKPGGEWRYVERGSDGENGFHGVYQEIVPPERLVYTFEWEGMPGHVLTDTIRLVALDGGKTRVTATSRFMTPEDRDGMLQSGMERGANESWDKLAELLSQDIR